MVKGAIFFFEIDMELQRKYYDGTFDDGWRKRKNNSFFNICRIIFNMSLKTFPILFFNMGGEMIYILEQRLSAQEIMDQKSVKGIQIRKKNKNRI